MIKYKIKLMISCVILFDRECSVHNVFHSPIKDFMFLHSLLDTKMKTMGNRNFLSWTQLLNTVIDIHTQEEKKSSNKFIEQPNNKLMRQTIWNGRKEISLVSVTSPLTWNVSIFIFFSCVFVIHIGMRTKKKSIMNL